MVLQSEDRYQTAVKLHHPGPHRGIIGWIGIANIHKADDNGQMLYENVTMPISQLGAISTAFQRVRVNLAKILLVQDRAEKQKYSEQIKELSAEITKNVEMAEKAFTGSEEKGLLKDFSDSRTVFRPLIGRIADLSMAGRDAEALAVYNGDATQAAMIEQAAVNKLVDFKVKQAAATAEQNTAMANAAIRSTLILAVVGIILQSVSASSSPASSPLPYRRQCAPPSW
ncbi:MCP four helix bundle domain-containing protein [Geotalea toluenoxydans]|uniref:MCP four helix bundle domain-containing protein n=1 Tax=Geotalea toluenoxydans TaxID=421624 RepID=UPI0006D1BBDA|nr:MCP four helix bundle domain-containing protein [Geotalea toluenoxydans]